MQDFVMNAWYMAGWSHEVGDEGLNRRLLGLPIFLARLDSGSLTAMIDRCPHRFAPLSAGSIRNGRIVCRYHGLEFDRTGTCVHNPFGTRIPTAAAVRTFETVERDGIIWFWPGEASQADPALVPDFAAASTGPSGTQIDGHTLVKANYEYVTDNLLDLSHIEFVHTGTFAGNGVIFQGQHSVERNGRRLDSNWWMPNVACPAGFKRQLQIDQADHWLDMRWDAPSAMLLKVGACAPGASRETGVELNQAHILTPADVDHTHYFWSSNSKYPLPAEQAAGMREMLCQAFDVEDKPVIEAAYANVEGDFWSMQPLSLGVDVGGARARRIVETLKQAEATPHAS